MDCCSPVKPEFVARCQPISAKTAITKLCELLEHPMAAHMIDRHILYLKQYIQASGSDGIHISDVDPFVRSMSIMVERVDSVPEYRPYILELTQLMSIPFILDNSTDEIAYEEDLAEYFNLIGFVLTQQNKPEIQTQVLTATILMLHRSLAKPDFVYISCTQVRRAIENSFLAGILTNILEISRKKSIFTFLLHLAILIINQSPAVCEKMVALNVLDCMILKLYPVCKIGCNYDVPKKYNPVDDIDSKYPYVDHVITFLWGVLWGVRCLPTERRRALTSPKLKSAWSLRHIFRRAVLRPNGQRIRNDILGIILLMISIFDDITDIVKCGIGADIALLCIAGQLPKTQSWVDAIKFFPSQEDLIFKKMLITAVCYSLKDPIYSQVIESFNVFAAFLNFITEYFENDRDDTKWSRPQEKDLLLTILEALVVLVPVLQDAFIKQNGFIKLMMLLEAYNVHRYESEILYIVLKIFWNSFQIMKQGLYLHFKNKPTFDIFLTICSNIMDNNNLTLHFQRILTFIFYIMEFIGSHIQINSGNFVFLPPKTNAFLLKFLNRVLRPKEGDACINNKMLMCFGVFLWQAAGWSDYKLRKFVESGGVYLILDIIERSIFPIKMLFLGILVDFCDEGLGSCIPHIITWRGGSNKKTTIVSMLLSIYRYENIRLEVGVTENGCIFDVELPIMGSQQWFETYYLHKTSTSSPAIVDLLCSCRPKVYALLQLLERHTDTINIANDHYRLFNKDLSTLDQVTLISANNFLALKLCELWSEVNIDLKTASIKPLSIDYENISALVKRRTLWATHLIELQNEIIERASEKVAENLQTYYRTLIDSTLQCALQNVREIEYVIRTTIKQYRHKQKEAQLDQARKSIHFGGSSKQHVTMDRALRVLPVYNLSIDIESTHVMNPFTKDRSNFHYQELVVDEKDEESNTLSNDSSNVGKCEKTTIVSIPDMYVLKL